MATFYRFATARLLVPCLAASVLAVGLLVGRDIVGPGGYRFLIWNLFLAWLPYLAALWVAWHAGRGPLGAAAAVPVFALWLLFLPNAPYLMTDLVHLPGMDFVWWYDVGTLLAFAWAGFLLGIASLFAIQGATRAQLGKAAGWAVVLGAAALSGVGVYVGRFLRWNSWDALVRPRALTSNLLSVFGDPSAYPRIVGVSGMIACMMLLGYMTLLSVRRAV